MGILYFGDNLDILREHIKDESIDLIYLDPPFNSKQAYNLLFKTPKGQNSDAEITAFEDTWHWGDQAETRVFRTSPSIQHRCVRNDSVLAPLLERKRHDGVCHDDGKPPA